jgi:class 3 adenylate cyclase
VPTNTFVGRARETAILRDAVTDVVAGRGRLIMLAGEPGIGKTRLAEETASYAAANGARVLWGRCWEGGGAPAFWPWIQLIRGSLGAGIRLDQILGEVEPRLTDIAQMVPELRSSLPPESPREPASGLPVADASRRSGPERFRLFDAITNLFKELAASTPLMMVLDDLHGADEDSLVLLRFLARELKQARILVVATYREVEVRQSAEHAALLSEIGREGTIVPLRGLSLDEIVDFIRRVAKLPADEEMVSSIQQATGGNPFFLDEIVRLIIAERDLGHAHRPGPGFAIPDSIRAAIRRRIRPLADQTKSLLTTAAVIGKEFDLALLQEVSGIAREQLVEALAEAAAIAVIVEPAGTADPYRFAHAITAEALRTGLGMSARAQLHQRIAAALERVYGGDLTPHLAQLAHHFTQALAIGGADKAIEYSRRGAERARSQLAFAEAVRLYGMALRALEATPQPDEVERCQTLLAMGEAQAQGGSLDQARRAFEQAAEIARRLGRPDLLAQSALHASAWFGTFFTLDRGLMALVEEALAAVGDGDSAIRASLMATLADERYWAGDRESGVVLSDDAVAMARRIGDPRALVSTLWVASLIRWGPEDVERRLASATEIASLAESIGDYQRALRAREMRFTTLLEIGDMQGVEAETRAYEALARQAGEQFGIVERFQAALALMRGDFERAERQIHELLTHAQRRQDPALLVCAQALSAALGEEQGRLEPPQIALAANALAQSPALAAQYRIVTAFVHLVSGRRAEVAAELESLMQDDCAAIPRDWNWLDNMRGLSIFSVALRDARHAAIVYDLLLPYADRNITTGWGDVARGSAALYLGSLAVMLGRLDDAHAHLERALRFNQRMGARPSVARAQFEYARMALKRNRKGDRETALHLLRESLATASELGMRQLEGRARVFLSRAGGDAELAVIARKDAGSIEAIAAAVMAEPSLLRAHAAPDGTLTILFSDVENSTMLFDALGDLRAQEILDAHNAIIRQHVALNRGFEVKSTGDGFMVVFSSARRALLCAIGIQRALAAYSGMQGHTPIRVRMGLHVGEPIKLPTDLSGTAVIVAARIASIAHAGEILVSSMLRELTESAGDLRFEEAGEVELKGLSGTRRLYRALW